MRDRQRDSEFAPDVREITMDELREFLEADLGGATADPKFKEELRQTLWDFLQRKNDRVEIDGNGS
jgi:hypothetical protein